MDTARVIQATFADWRTVKGRKQLQIILEVPLEKQGEVLTMLGAPDPANPTWCAVAVLDLRCSSTVEHSAVNRGVGGSNPSAAAIPKERRPFNSLPLSQQCAIRCNDPDFRRWADSIGWQPEIASIVDWVRHQCDVKSRAELDDNIAARQKWRELEEQYQAYLTDRMYPEEARR